MPETIKKITPCCLAACILTAILCIPATVFTQTARQIERKAEASFNAQDYYNAAKLYASILYDSPLVTKTPSLVYPFRPDINSGHTQQIAKDRRAVAQYRLAESYRLYYHYKDAVPQYEQYIQSQDTKFPLARLWYGLSLLATDEPEKAIGSFNVFLQKYKRQDTLSQKAQLGIADANFRIASRTVRPEALISKMNTTVSADGSNFGMEKISDGSFWFTSSRHEVNRKKEKIYPVRLYAVNNSNNTVEKITGIAGEDMNTGASSLSADGLTLFFTGWKEDKNAVHPNYRIYTATRISTTSKWNTPVSLPASINVQGYNAKQPFISRNGQYLFFASDKPGGFGKYDIWIVGLDNGRVTGAPFNPGSHVNSTGNEATPFYDADSSLLFYSSDGMTGMGGLDIYKIKGAPAAGEWNETAVNLGVPFNSVKDDLYFIKETNSDTGYLSSDRNSNCCLEIFKSVQLHYIDTPATVKNKPVTLPPQLPPVAGKDTMQQHMADSINAITVERLHVNYNFASTQIRKVDRVQLDHVVQLLKTDPSLNILIASFTDCIGSPAANISLSRKRSESVKRYLLQKGIGASRINLDFYGKKHLVLACKEDNSYNKEQQLANRRSDLIVTHDPEPKWQPTGEELDIRGTQRDPLRDRRIAYNAGKPEATNDKTTDRSNQKENNTNDKTAALNVAAAKSDGKDAGNKNNVTVQPTNRSNTGVNEQKENIAANGRSNTGNNTKTKEQKEAGVTKAAGEDPMRSSTGKDRNGRGKQKDGSANGLAAATTAKNPVAVKNKNAKDAAPSKITMAKTEPIYNPVTRKTADSLHTMMKIAQLLDFTPRVKNADVINEMTSRTPRKSFEVFTTSDSVKIELYDNGVFDNDSVSVIYNRQLTIYKQMLLTNKPIRFYVKLDPDQAKNEMIFFAENMGITPPNSALMIITDGDNKRTEVNVTSDLQHNAVIYFIKVKK